jgi:hypothetical protein
MIAKLVKGSGFRGALGYLMEGPKKAPREQSHLIATNMAGRTPRQLSQEFGVLRRLRPTLGKAVCHASISLAPEDRSLTDEEFSFIAKKFLAGMGFADCPFIAVRHEDTTHQHIHVLVSRITTSGEVVGDKNDFTRAEKIMRELEHAYMLRAPTQLPTERKVINDAVNKPLTGVNKMKNEIRNAVEEAINESSDFRQFIDGCKRRGVIPMVHMSGNRVCGFAFRKGKLRVKGSELGRTFTWDALRQRLDYQEATDFPVLEELLRIEREGLQSATCPHYTDAKSKREQARRLLDDEYIAKIRAKFSDDLADIQRDKSMLEITFNDGAVLRDFGDRLASDDGDSKQIALRMVAIALVKGWPAISFTGNDEFVREAMRTAIALGLPVVAKDASQTRLLAEVQAEGNSSANMALAPNQSDAIRARIDAMRTRYQPPAEPDPNQTQRHFKL